MVSFSFKKKKKKSLPFKLLFLTVITYLKRLSAKVKKINSCPHQKTKPESGHPVKICPLINKAQHQQQLAKKPRDCESITHWESLNQTKWRQSVSSQDIFLPTYLFFLLFPYILSL